MSRSERQAAIRAEIDRRDGVVPSVRVMARALGLSRSLVADTYHQLALKSHAKPGRPAVLVRLGVPVSVSARLPVETYDRYCEVARDQQMSVRAAIRAAVLLGPR